MPDRSDVRTTILRQQQRRAELLEERRRYEDIYPLQVLRDAEFAARGETSEANDAFNRTVETYGPFDAASDGALDRVERAEVVLNEWQGATATLLAARATGSPLQTWGDVQNHPGVYGSYERATRLQRNFVRNYGPLQTGQPSVAQAAQIASEFVSAPTDAERRSQRPGHGTQPPPDHWQGTGPGHGQGSSSRGPSLS